MSLLAGLSPGLRPYQGVLRCLFFLSSLAGFVHYFQYTHVIHSSFYKGCIMSEHCPIYGNDADALRNFPEPLQEALHLVGSMPSSEASLILLQCVASVAHPDYLVNLSILSSLPLSHKNAALSLIQHSVSQGLSFDLQAALLRYVQPLMLRSLHPLNSA